MFRLLLLSCGLLTVLVTAYSICDDDPTKCCLEVADSGDYQFLCVTAAKGEGTRLQVIKEWRTRYDELDYNQQQFVKGNLTVSKKECKAVHSNVKFLDYDTRRALTSHEGEAKTFDNDNFWSYEETDVEYVDTTLCKVSLFEVETRPRLEAERWWVSDELLESHVFHWPEYAHNWFVIRFPKGLTQDGCRMNDKGKHNDRLTAKGVFNQLYCDLISVRQEMFEISQFYNGEPGCDGVAAIAASSCADCDDGYVFTGTECTKCYTESWGEERYHFPEDVADPTHQWCEDGKARASCFSDPTEEWRVYESDGRCHCDEGLVCKGNGCGKGRNPTTFELGCTDCKCEGRTCQSNDDCAAFTFCDDAGECAPCQFDYQTFAYGCEGLTGTARKNCKDVCVQEANDDCPAGAQKDEYWGFCSCEGDLVCKGSSCLYDEFLQKDTIEIKPTTTSIAMDATCEKADKDKADDLCLTECSKCKTRNHCNQNKYCVVSQNWIDDGCQTPESIADQLHDGDCESEMAGKRVCDLLDGCIFNEYFMFGRLEGFCSYKLDKEDCDYECSECNFDLNACDESSNCEVKEDADYTFCEWKSDQNPGTPSDDERECDYKTCNYCSQNEDACWNSQGCYLVEQSKTCKTADKDYCKKQTRDDTFTYSLCYECSHNERECNAADGCLYDAEFGGCFDVFDEEVPDDEDKIEACQNNCGICAGDEHSCEKSGCMVHYDKCVDPPEGSMACEKDCSLCNLHQKFCEKANGCTFFGLSDVTGTGFCFSEESTTTDAPGPALAYTKTQKKSKPKLQFLCEEEDDQGNCKLAPRKMPWLQFEHKIPGSQIIYTFELKIGGTTVINFAEDLKPGTRRTFKTNALSQSPISWQTLNGQARGIVRFKARRLSEDPNINTTKIFTSAPYVIVADQNQSYAKLNVEDYLAENIPPKGSKQMYILSALVFKKDAKEPNANPLRNGGAEFDRQSFKLAIVDALNSDNQKCELGGSECQEEFKSISSQDVFTLDIDFENRTVLYQVRVEKDDAFAVQSRILHAYFKFPLAVALYNHGIEFGDSTDMAGNFAKLEIDSKNSAVLAPPSTQVVSEAEGISDTVKIVIGGACAFVAIGLVFVVVMMVKNRKRSKVLDLGEKALTQKLKEFEEKQKRLDDEAKQLKTKEREQKQKLTQLQREVAEGEAEINSELGEQQKAEMQSIEAELETIGDDVGGHDVELLHRMQNGEDLSMKEQIQVQCVLAGGSVEQKQNEDMLKQRDAERAMLRVAIEGEEPKGDPEVEKQLQKLLTMHGEDFNVAVLNEFCEKIADDKGDGHAETMKTQLEELRARKKAARQMKKAKKQQLVDLEASEHQEKVILAKVEEGTTLDTEEKAIMAQFAEGEKRRKAMMSSDAIAQKEAVLKRVERREARRAKLKEQQQQDQGNAEVEQEIKEIEQALVEEAVVVNKLETGEELANSEKKMVEEQIDNHQKELMAEYESNKKKLDSRVANDMNAQSDALSKRIEAKKEKRRVLEAKKAAIQAEAASKANVEKAKHHKRLESKKAQLASCISILKNTGNQLKRNEREAQKIKSQAEKVNREVSAKMANESDDKQQKMHKRLEQRRRKKFAKATREKEQEKQALMMPRNTLVSENV